MISPSADGCRDLQLGRDAESRPASGSGPTSSSSGSPAKTPRPSWRTVQDFPCTSSRAGATVPPNASTIAWCPRQTPSVGVLCASRRTISGVAPASAGRPGPGEMTRCEGASRSAAVAVDRVVSTHDDLGAELAEQMREVVRERVVVVDSRINAAPPPRGRSPLRRPRACADTPRVRRRASESATIPAPACRCATPSRRTIVLIAMHVSSVPSLRQCVADGARVRTPPSALELRDQLHRPHLRCAGDRSRREACAQQVERRDAVAQVARHLRDEVRHVGVAFYLEELLDLDGARHADTREIVAAEVDEHHVLGSILLGCEQPLGIAVASLGRAGDRVDAGAASLALDERLGRRSDQREPVELEQEEIRGRVDTTQRAVELQRRRRGGSLGALREHDLERVARADVFLRRANRCLVVRRGPGCVARSRASRSTPGRAGHRLCEQRRRPRRRSPRITSRGPEDVVEPDQHVRDEEAALGQSGAVVGKRDGRLQPSGVVVGEVADDGLPARLGLGEVAEVRAAADERVAAEASPFDGFEQEGRAALAAQPQVGAERCDEIGAMSGAMVISKSSIEWAGTQKDLPVEGLDERNGLFWPRSTQAQAPAPLAAPGPGASCGSHRRPRVGTARGLGQALVLGCVGGRRAVDALESATGSAGSMASGITPAQTAVRGRHRRRSAGRCGSLPRPRPAAARGSSCP